MRVLVTGSQGYIGVLLTPMLRRRGYRVIGLDSDLFAGCDFGEAASGAPDWRMDVRDCKAANLRNFQAVIHLAGLSNDPLGDLDPQLTFDVNYQATVRLAWLAKAAGVERFIFASTCSVYGAAGDEWIDEASALNPVTPYAQAKANAEEDLRSLANDRFSVTLLRNATAYGDSPRLRGDLVVNNLVGYAITTGRVLLKSAGVSWRPLVHVEDIARAMVAVLEAPRDSVHNEVFNVGRTTDNYLVREIATRIADAVPNSEVAFAKGVQADARSYRVCCEKLAHTVPAAAPQWDLDDAIRGLMQSYLRCGLNVSLLEGETLQRLKRVRALMASGQLDADLRWTHPQEMAYAS